MEFSVALQKALSISGLLREGNLKEEQVQVLKEFYNGFDTLALMPTGYGKSLLYQLTPFLHSIKHSDATISSSTLVISPLNAIIKTQTEELCKKGIPACYLDYNLNGLRTFKHQSATDSSDEEENQDDYEISCSLDSLSQNNYRLIYSHPEALLSTKKGSILLKKVLPKFISCVAIDEAHMVAEWGPKFRQDFSRLKELFVHLPTVQVMLLTATATTKVQKLMADTLEITNLKKIMVYPDRPNIKYNVEFRKPSQQQEDFLDTLLKDLAKKIKEDPDFGLTFFYTDYKTIEDAINIFDGEFPGQEKYNGKESKVENLIYQMYHGSTMADVQSIILNQLTGDKPNCKIVFATTALGMGLNAPHVRSIIIYKSPPSLDQFIQQAGRAGRDGSSSTVTLYYNNTDLANSKNKKNKIVEKSMINFCKSKTCLREQMVKHLSFEFVPLADDDSCCSVCTRNKEAEQAAQEAAERVSSSSRSSMVTDINNLLFM